MNNKLALNSRLVELFQLPPTTIKATIEMTYDELPRITIERYIEDTPGLQEFTTTERFQIVDTTPVTRVRRTRLSFVDRVADSAQFDFETWLYWRAFEIQEQLHNDWKAADEERYNQ